MKCFIAICFALVCAVSAETDPKREFDEIYKKLVAKNVAREQQTLEAFEKKEKALFDYRESNRDLVFGLINDIKIATDGLPQTCADQATQGAHVVTKKTNEFIENIYSYHIPEISAIRKRNEDALRSDRQYNNNLLDKFMNSADDEKYGIIEEANAKLQQQYLDTEIEKMSEVIALASMYSYSATTYLMSNLRQIRSDMNKCAGQ